MCGADPLAFFSVELYLFKKALRSTHHMSYVHTNHSVTPVLYRFLFLLLVKQNSNDLILQTSIAQVCVPHS